MAPHRSINRPSHRSTERDNGMRRISSTTRWLAGVGVALVAGFSGYFAAQASSSSSSTPPSVQSPAATAPSQVGEDDGGGVSQAQPTQTAPPVTYAPQPHTRTHGS